MIFRINSNTTGFVVYLPALTIFFDLSVAALNRTDTIDVQAGAEIRQGW
jgi:hypothetical protein